MGLAMKTNNKPVQIRIPTKTLVEIDQLITKGVYTNRSEAIRDAVRRMLK